MAFSNFKNIEQVIERYPLKIVQQRFLPDVQGELPELFLENLEFSLRRQAVDENEAFLRESLIFPFLHHVWKRHDCLKIWANRSLYYDDILSGEPDYFLSRWPDEVTDKLVISPMLAVVEAKRQDFEEGWGQCLAAMLACQKLNGDKPLTVFGIVSTGLIWEFGKLEGACFTRDPIAHSLESPQKLAGLLDALFAECEKQLS